MAQEFGRRRTARSDTAPSARRLWPASILLAPLILLAGAAAYFFATPRQQPTIADVQQPPLRPAEPVAFAHDESVGGDGPTYPVVNPHTICKERYPLDLDMRDTCVTVQREAKLLAETIRIDKDVMVECATRYLHDWSGYAVCAKGRMDEKLPAADKPTRPHFDVQDKCETQWPGNEHMAKYCMREQREARDKAEGIKDDIAIACTADYPNDWRMFMYCVGQKHGQR